MPPESRRDDWLGAIAAIVLLIGTATGNAYAILGMSVTVLVLTAIFCRHRIKSGAILVAVAAAVAAAAIGFVMAIG